MSTVFDKIKGMDKKELADFIKERFWGDGGGRARGLPCEECLYFNTHHYPKDCKDESDSNKDCPWLKIGSNYEEWLGMDASVEDNNFGRDAL